MALALTPEALKLVQLVFAVLGLVWYAALWAIGLLGCWAARKRYRLRPRSPLSSAPASAVPGVSIIRPLKGLDTNLYENLESTFTQEYPNYELFLCVADETDQALPVARDLIAKYPNVKARIIIGEEIVGVNPKVNNLMKAYHQVSHDIIWVLDSGVMAHSGTLARSVDALDPPVLPAGVNRRRIGLVHHVPFAWSSTYGSGSRIEEAFLNTNHARMYLAINTVAVESCVIGKSNVFRKSDLEQVDGSLKPLAARPAHAPEPKVRGLAAMGRFLAEDNMLSASLWHELGLRHELSCDVVRNAVGSMTLADYVWRRVRWVRVRKRMVLFATLLEPLTESVQLAIIAALALWRLFGALAPLLFLPTHFALWLLMDLDVYHSLAEHPLPAAQRWPFIASWACRELLSFPIWLFAMSGNQVSWRGTKYEMLSGGEVRLVEPRQRAHWRNPFHWGSKKKAGDHYEMLETED